MISSHLLSWTVQTNALDLPVKIGPARIFARKTISFVSSCSGTLNFQNSHFTSNFAIWKGWEFLGLEHLSSGPKATALKASRLFCPGRIRCGNEKVISREMLLKLKGFLLHRKDLSKQ